MLESLEKLGIRPAQEVSLDVLLGEHFNGALYGLDSRQMARVRALRDVVASYEKGSAGPVRRVSCAKDAALILYPVMKNLAHEEVSVIFLNNVNAVLHVERLYSGSTAEVAFSARDIVSRALSVNATALVVAHNHPSGDPNPSACDIRQTETLKKACELFELALLDHVIISRGRYYSFAEERTSAISI